MAGEVDRLDLQAEVDRLDLQAKVDRLDLQAEVDLMGQVPLVSNAVEDLHA
jgi:hypothetical protein